MKNVKRKNAGITLIALVITIIVLLILASVTISALSGENGIITQASNAKVLTNISSLKEEIDIYEVGEELNDTEGIERYPVIKEETMENIDKNKLSLELKQKMSKWANKAQDGEIATVDTIDYSKFYKIDKEKVQTANNFDGDLYLVEVGGEYKVISIEGLMYNKENINIVIPLNDIAEPQYITVGNNTYKFYGDGKLSVIGELNSNSGMTSEENENLNGLQELNIKKIAEGTDMAFSNNVETNQNIAKANGVKQILLKTGTAYIIDANDDLWAWGDNSYNRLGQGNSYLVAEPIKILEGRTEGATGVKAKEVWAGPLNTFVLDTNNRLWGCGVNAKGTLGQGNNNVYNNFVEIKVDGLDNSKIEKIDLGYVSKQESVAFIQDNNGNIYAAGNNEHGVLGIGNRTNQNRFINLSNQNEIWDNVKTFCTGQIYTFALTEDGILYGTGYNATGALGLGHKNNTIIELTKITDNVKDVKIKGGGFIALKENGEIYTNDSNGNLVKVSGLQDSEAKLLDGNMVLSKNKIYILNTTSYTLKESYNCDEEMYFSNMEGYILESKIYLKGYPDLTLPKQKSVYQLKNILNNVQYVQGGMNLNIVDKDGNIYEGLNNKITEISNIKQLVSSDYAKCALSENGSLYAKGQAYMWGDTSSKANYTQITKDGTEYFNNIDKIFSIKKWCGLIFITKDNEMYWSGSEATVAIPEISGDISATGLRNVTKYPKKVENDVINQIIDKIVDIKFSYINQGGIQGGNTLILTNDGKLYIYSNNANMTGVGETSDFTEIKFDGATVEQIETLDGLSLAILSNGEVYGWGYNTYGILGEGYEVGEIYKTPVKLNLSNVRYMSLGEGFAIFATHAGEIYGIGKNDYGQLGTGDNIGASTFVRCEELEK